MLLAARARVCTWHHMYVWHRICLQARSQPIAKAVDAIGPLRRATGEAFLLFPSAVMRRTVSPSAAKLNPRALFPSAGRLFETSHTVLSTTPSRVLSHLCCAFVPFLLQ